ncbi:MAG: SPOR domain-containing protein [Gallionellaceae bacterium]|jgi:cell division protein FtsN|nr:SPOR domain-containing protein [Gallionellaceae bacterium]
MSRNTGNKPAAPRKGGSQLLAGILVGMVIGVALAAGLAWYLMKSPSPFTQKEPVAARSPAAATKPATPAAATAPNTQSTTAASGVSDAKPRFEFYKVLTDKQDTAAPADKPKPAKSTTENKPAANEPQFLQAGSFSNADDAEKLKAKLAMLGIEASTHAATLPDKGVWYRVRLGPYKNADELNQARALLKQNGVDATPTRAQ